MSSVSLAGAVRRSHADEDGVVPHERVRTTLVEGEGAFVKLSVTMASVFLKHVFSQVS